LERYYQLDELPVHQIEDDQGRIWTVAGVHFEVTRPPKQEGIQIMWDILPPNKDIKLSPAIYYRFDRNSKTFNESDTLGPTIQDAGKKVSTTILEHSTKLLNAFIDQLKDINKW
jgi:hypothetical protein